MDSVSDTSADPAVIASGADAATITLRPTARAIIMALLGAAVLLTALDQTVVVTALLPIANTFELPPEPNLHALSWVVSGYLLGYVIVMPLMGRVSDILGRRRILIACLSLFAVGSLLCAAAPNLGEWLPLNFLAKIGITSPSDGLSWLILARFLQAIGGGSVVPAAIAMIGDMYGERHRGTALGIIGGVTEAGGALGPLYGALIIQNANWTWGIFSVSWQWIFLLNIPLAAAICVAIIFLWPARADTKSAAQKKTLARVDWLGSLMLGISLLLLSSGLSQEAGALGSFSGAQAPQNNPLLIILGLVVFALFIALEMRAALPIISLRLFANIAFSADALFSALIGVVLIAALVDIPTYILTLTSGSGYLSAGLALLRMTALIPIGAFLGGVLTSRFGSRFVGFFGSLLIALGFFVMSRWGSVIDWNMVTLGAVISGSGFGLVVAPISVTALNAAPKNSFGVSAAVITALRMTGMILGLAALSSWGVQHYIQLARQIPAPTNITSLQQVQAYGNALTAAAAHTLTDFFGVAVWLALAAAICSLLLWKPSKGTETVSETFSIGF